MKYRYTAIFSIRGLRLAPGEGEKVLVVDSAIGLRAILTSEPDAHASEGDRSLAVAGLMLRAFFNSEHTSNELKQRVAAAVEELRGARQKEFGNGPFLIVTGEGEAAFNARHERDAQDFIVCFDGADKGNNSLDSPAPSGDAGGDGGDADGGAGDGPGSGGRR